MGNIADIDISYKRDETPGKDKIYLCLHIPYISEQPQPHCAAVRPHAHSFLKIVRTRRVTRTVIKPSVLKNIGLLFLSF